MNRQTRLRLYALGLTMLMLFSSLGLNIYHSWCKCSGKEVLSLIALEKSCGQGEQGASCCQKAPSPKAKKSCCSQAQAEETPAWINWTTGQELAPSFPNKASEVFAQNRCCGQDIDRLALEQEFLPELETEFSASKSCACPQCQPSLRPSLVLPKLVWPRTDLLPLHQTGYYYALANKAPPQRYTRSLDYLQVIQVYRC